MNPLFWQRMHGGSTHFPIALLLVSVVLDFAAWRSQDEGLRRGLQMAGLGAAVVGVLGGCGAVVSGLVMTRGQMLGNEFEKFHHLFVWPAFGGSAVLVVWRVSRRGQILQRTPLIYLGGMSVTSALMMGAGFWGGEMLLGAESKDAGAPGPMASQTMTELVATGHKLYLLNCAHCHADDATGDEGPDLHDVTKSDARIASMIKNGVKGEMPKFATKLSDDQVRALIAYVRSLN